MIKVLPGVPLVAGNENHPYALGCDSEVWLCHVVEFIKFIHLWLQSNRVNLRRCSDLAVLL